MVSKVESGARSSEIRRGLVSAYYQSLSNLRITDSEAFEAAVAIIEAASSSMQPCEVYDGLSALEMLELLGLLRAAEKSDVGPEAALDSIRERVRYEALGGGPLPGYAQTYTDHFHVPRIS